MLVVAVAFVVHGLLQLVSDLWRAYLQRARIAWRSVACCAIGAAVALVGVSAGASVPSRPLTYLLLGLVPALVWLPMGWLHLDAERPAHAAAAGLLVTVHGAGGGPG